MTQSEKAEKYDFLVREGDKIQAKISKLKSHHVTSNTQGAEFDKELGRLNGQMNRVVNEMNILVANG